MTTDCLVIGAGGHAASVVDAMRCAGLRPVAILDKDPDQKGRSVMNVPVVGDDSALELELCRPIQCFVIAVGSTRAGDLRRSLFGRACAAGKRPLTVIHPRAIVAASAAIGAGSVILAGAVINPRAQLGVNVIVNTLAAVEHDCDVGDHSHIATGARLCGTVSVGADAHIGAGATILQGTTIGDKAVIGAGAVVLSDIPAATTAVGVPARIL